MDALSRYRELTTDVFTNRTLNITQMNRYSGYFIETCEDFYHTKSTFYYETVDRPERILVQRLEDIRKRKADLIRIKSNMLNALETLQNTSNSVTDGALVRIQGVIRNAHEYFKLGNRTKLSVSDLFHSREFTSDISKVRQFLQEVATRGAFLFDTWLSMATTVKHIWKDIIEDVDLNEYYIYKNYTEFLRDATAVDFEINTKFQKVRADTDMRFIVGNKEVLFFSAVNEVQMELMKFNESTKFDEEVLKYDLMLCI